MILECVGVDQVMTSGMEAVGIERMILIAGT